MKLYNTLNKKVEEFIPNNKDLVTLYTCGPTVYHYAHIGNLRTYIFEDILEKGLEYLGYNVKRCMNITDVGHMSSDADTGEDKKKPYSDQAISDRLKEYDIRISRRTVNKYRVEMGLPDKSGRKMS